MGLVAGTQVRATWSSLQVQVSQVPKPRFLPTVSPVGLISPALLQDTAATQKCSWVGEFRDLTGRMLAQRRSTSMHTLS